MPPNYTQIYHDMLQIDHPEKLQDPKIMDLLQNLRTTDDVLNLNKKLFKPSKDNQRDNQQLRSYDEQTILKLLRYQRRHGFSISYMSKKYGISRTTLSKWNKIFEKQL